jgi:tellurite resistance protein TerC
MLNTFVWIAFFILTLGLVIFDIFILSKKSHSKKQIAIQTLVWVCFGLLFSTVIYVLFKYELVKNPNQLSPTAATLKYLSGYLVELSLSIDNLFVILMLFTSFKIAKENQHKALFWGIIGALVFRGLMIGFGIILIEKIEWMTYVLGFFLLFTALKMLFTKEKETATEKELPVWLTKYIPYDKNASKSIFIEKANNKTVLTPLFGVLILIELTDVVFALDSIPAILGITTDPFIVYTSNIFAILGLRSMYFFLSELVEKFSLLKYSVIVILIFVAIKLLVIKFHHFNEITTLLVIFCALSLGVLLSIYRNKNKV